MDFLKKYWLEVIFGIIVTAFSGLAKWLYSKVKNEFIEQEALKTALMAMLHDRIYQICSKHLTQGAISMADLDNLDVLFKSYAELGGNGACEEIHCRCKKLPIK